LTQVKAPPGRLYERARRMAPVPEDTAEDCLARAEYAVRQAKNSSTDEDRRRWLEIAEEWRTLALMARAKKQPREAP
jgi:hypothetical protein